MCGIHLKVNCMRLWRQVSLNNSPSLFSQFLVIHKVLYPIEHLFVELRTLSSEYQIYACGEIFQVPQLDKN